MFTLELFEKLPVRIIIVALLIILTVYLIRKSIKLFFDKTSFLDENREETLMHFAYQVTKLMGLVFFFIYVLSHFFNLTRLVTGSVVVAHADFFDFPLMISIDDHIIPVMNLTFKQVSQPHNIITEIM